MKRTLLLLIGSVLAISSVNAQLIYEITPSIGWRTGGGFDFTPQGSNTTQRFDFDSEIEYGAKLGLGFSPSFFLELEWNRQPTQLSRAGIVGADTALGVNVDYFHGGMLFQYAYDRLQPFGFFSMGVTAFYPEGDLSSRTRFSLGGGLGIKYFVTHMVGLRMQGRFYSTTMGSDPSGYWCDFYGCWSTSTVNWLTQWSFGGGVFVRFGGNPRRRRY